MKRFSTFWHPWLRYAVKYRRADSAVQKLTALRQPGLPYLLKVFSLCPILRTGKSLFPFGIWSTNRKSLKSEEGRNVLKLLEYDTSTTWPSLFSLSLLEEWKVFETFDFVHSRMLYVLSNGRNYKCYRNIGHKNDYSRHVLSLMNEIWALFCWRAVCIPRSTETICWAIAFPSEGNCCFYTWSLRNSTFFYMRLADRISFH